MNCTTQIHDESGIQSAYGGESVARNYVADRFVAELYRLLHDRQVAAVQEAMDRLHPARTLEIAPGPGRLTRCMNPPGELVCLEFNEGMLAEGKRTCGGKATWVRGNAFQLPFGQEFDLAYSFRFIRHFRRADRDRLYAGIRQVLRPGGHLIMDAINACVSKPIRDANPDDYRVFDELYRPEELRAEMAQAGFEIVRMVPVQKRYTWQHRSQVFLGPRANWLNRLVIRGLEMLPWRDGLEWVVTCRRA